MAWGRVGERSGKDLGWRLERWLEARSSRCPAGHGVGGLSAFGGRSEQRAAPRRLLTWHDGFCEKPSRGAPSEPGSSRRGRATGITRLRRDRDIVGRWDTENVSVVCSGPPSTHHGCHVETRLPAPMRGNRNFRRRVGEPVDLVKAPHAVGHGYHQRIQLCCLATVNSERSAEPRAVRCTLRRCRAACRQRTSTYGFRRAGSAASTARSGCGR